MQTKKGGGSFVLELNKRYIHITKMSDTSITVIYHAMSLTVLLFF